MIKNFKILWYDIIKKEFPSKESLLPGCVNIEFMILNNDTNVKLIFFEFCFSKFFSLFCMCDMKALNQLSQIITY